MRNYPAHNLNFLSYLYRKEKMKISFNRIGKLTPTMNRGIFEIIVEGDLTDDSMENVMAEVCEYIGDKKFISIVNRIIEDSQWKNPTEIIQGLKTIERNSSDYSEAIGRLMLINSISKDLLENIEGEE
jgi:hypothetical protein